MATHPDHDPHPADSGVASSVAEAARGSRSYDSLDEHGQAAIRSIWRKQINGRLAALDLRSEFEAAGVVYSELDAEGGVVIWSAAP
jgi:hypothetical protein